MIVSEAQEKEKSRSKYFSQIDGIRAIAVMLVILGHYGRSVSQYLPSGGAGVKIFFVISGFLITGILISTLEKSRAANQSLFVTIRQFFIRRILRIFPPYFAALFIGFALNLGDWQQYWPWLVLFAGNWYMVINDCAMSPYSPYWSVAVEEQFYIFWPVVVFGCSLRLLGSVTWSLVVCSILFKVIGVFTGVTFNWLYVSTFSSLDALGIGAILAIYHKTNQKNKFDRLCQISFYFGAPIFLLTHIAKMVGWGSPVGTQLYYLSAAALGVYLIGKATDDSKWLLKGLLENRVVRYVGQISYGLYLYHMLVFAFALRLCDYFDIPWGQYPILRVCLLILISFGISALSFHFLEQPINRRKDRYPYVVAKPANDIT